MTGARNLRKRSLDNNDSSSVYPSCSSDASATSSSSQIGVWADRHGIVLLLMLYTAQGLPMGLIFGSIPFLLKAASVSYADIGAFSLCSLPYALKLFIAPMVDGGPPPLAIGRRPGWIVPPLFTAGALLFLLASPIEDWVTTGKVRFLTPLCFIIISLTAIQDVAVDGWSLELLSKSNVAYASMCQSLGTSMGYIAAFTVFLALNDPSFCRKYFWRFFSPGASGAAVSLAGATRITGGIFISVAAAVALRSFSERHKEKASDDELVALDTRSTHSTVNQRTNERLDNDDADNQNVVVAYRTLLRILKLQPVQQLVFVLLIAKAGFSAYDSAVSLKLIDHGFPKETLAFITVIQAPVQLLGTVVVGRWAANGCPEVPYLAGYALRFLLSLTGPAIVRTFSGMHGVVTGQFYASLVVLSIIYGIASDCLMFVSIGAFFLRITSSSASIGGTYLTLLYAAQNMGGMWPRSVTLALVERLTVREACWAGTECSVVVDGFYVISAISAVFAGLVGLYLNRTMRRLAKLPLDSWKPIA